MQPIYNKTMYQFRSRIEIEPPQKIKQSLTHNSKLKKPCKWFCICILLEILVYSLISLSNYFSLVLELDKQFASFTILSFGWNSFLNIIKSTLTSTQNSFLNSELSPSERELFIPSHSHTGLCNSSLR